MNAMSVCRNNVETFYSNGKLYVYNWFLHQDNDPKHTSHYARTCLKIFNVIWGKLSF